MSDAPTPLRLPPTLPYPIAITRILQDENADLRRGTPLIEYAFTSVTSRRALAAGKSRTEEGTEAKEYDIVGSWECPVEGLLVRWYPWVRPGQKVDKRDASRPILDIQQPCSHPVQLHGLCGICGKELTENDYLAPPADMDPAAGPSGYNGGYEMSHDALGVTVSTHEAKRLDDQTKENLLRTRRLSLIVDLDQTIIHTTVDPTVGEWMAEIREEQQEDTENEAESSADNSASAAPAQESARADAVSGSTTPPGTPPAKRRRIRREPNPNAEALRDVAQFNLADDVPPGHPSSGRKMKMPDRWYYTKPRPGLQPFLNEMSEMYEMHVYTMGTREYADAICKVIDPDSKIFGGRVLSRDESGSFSSKNLKRLFPTDQSMVVVIDDRSDVWADIPNLVKVVPYDFFVGIGDINGSVLPPNPSTQSSPISPSSESPSSAASTPPPLTPSDDMAADADSITRQKMLLDNLSEQRPLKKLQEEMDLEQALTGSTAQGHEGKAAGEAEAESSPRQEKLLGSASEQGHRKKLQEETDVARALTGVTAQGDDGKEATGPESASRGKLDTAPTPSSPHRKPLLKDDDNELERIGNILTEVHRSYYAAYDARDKDSQTGKLPMGCDVELIIPDLKQRVLEDCHIVFSGVVPRHLRPPDSEIWRMAEAFGAIPQENITASTTHCVTANPSTEKAYRVNKAGGKVVWTEWFWQSVALWQKLDETQFLAVQQATQSSNTSAVATVTDPPISGVHEADRPAEPGSPLEAEVRNTEADLAGGDRTGASENEPSTAAVSIDDPDFAAGEWNDEDDKEWADFMEDEDGDAASGSDAGTGDARSDAGASTTGSVPGTPRKRVRYADEEHLPLESFKEPEPGLADIEGVESRPKKRKAIMLPYYTEGDERAPDGNRIQLSGGDGKGMSKALRMDWDAAAPDANAANSEEAKPDSGAVEQDLHAADQASEPDDDDEFARMLMDELDD